MNSKINFCFLATCLLAGCASETTSDFNSVEGNFGYVTHIRGFTDRSLSAGFCYRDTNGIATVVWPSLKIVPGNNMVVNNNSVVLIGGKATAYDDGIERQTARLIAFKGPDGPPMDITDQVLIKYYTETGMSPTNFLWDSFGTLSKTNDSIQILFGSKRIRAGTNNIWEWFDSTMTISWQDIEAIMTDIKKNGKLKKEKWSGTEYLQKD
ncbi:MAG TPA: hypothetical protein VNN22_03690 [Verrucomicrobiae bacterium]|nr:hypothetical protein [Verrucomicrobiae bacterium]